KVSNIPITSPSFGSSSTSAPHYNYKYDVFISFRGEDTRHSFAAHLHRDLIGNGISVFKDHEELHRGKEISPGLLQAIEDSRLSIVIFSNKYATSSWCLDELVHILECSRNPENPLFQSSMTSIRPSFDINQALMQQPLLNSERSTGQRMLKCSDFCIVDLELTLLDFQLPSCSLVEFDIFEEGKREKKFITDIVGKITRKLNKRATIIRKRELVGIDSRVQEFLSILDTSVKDVHIIGIWGMAGVGKKTLAYFIYEKIYDQYEACCFLANVTESSEKGYLVYLQEKLLAGLEGEPILVNDLQHGIEQIRQHFCNVKCLIVLNGVNKLEQLDALVGEANWFGLGSRIIITTRDAHLLNSKGVNKIYTCKGLNPAEAMELFA
ncbi:disease resistance protein Roq1-like, partial [Ziziphus jujuba]|uniref:Disease resistance protein Roq1-like n=1 Tax=Ziziphus jujuba TaxID=326968 RepID=A0ABM4A516_ZIZJJ